MCRCDCKVKLTCILPGAHRVTVWQQAVPAQTATLWQGSATAKSLSPVCSVTDVSPVPATSTHSTHLGVAKVSEWFLSASLSLVNYQTVPYSLVCLSILSVHPSIGQSVCQCMICPPVCLWTLAVMPAHLCVHPSICQCVYFHIWLSVYAIYHLICPSMHQSNLPVHVSFLPVGFFSLPPSLLFTVPLFLPFKQNLFTHMFILCFVAAPSQQPAPVYKPLSPTSMNISWSPPDYPNGVIVLYRLFRNDTLQFEAKGEAAP